MIEVMVELICDRKISIDEAKSILRRAKVVSGNGTRALHTECFHHLFYDFALQTEVRRMVWSKLSEKGGQ